MKLMLGTAQFGSKYGVANERGVVPPAEVSAILDCARTSDVDMLDTAVAYGSSEQVLGSVGVRGFGVVTKLPRFPDECTDVSGWVYSQILGAMHRLRCGSLYGVLLHTPSQLLSSRGCALYDAMLGLKRDGLVGKVGVSVYDTEELEKLCSRYSFDLVQAPLNIFDRRLVDSGWSVKLSQMGVEIHCRSVFLQGLLLMPPEKRPSFFAAWSDVWQRWDGWLLKTGLTPLEACIQYMSTVDSVDRAIVGVDSLNQLKQIISAGKGSLRSVPDIPALSDSRLLNPATWG